MEQLKQVRNSKNAIIELAQNLITIPSLTGDEEIIAGVILEKLKAFGIQEAWIDEIGNVIGVIRGHGTKLDVLLNGHMDVVPPGNLENWDYDPFGAQIDDLGNIHGRGAADMKGGLTALLFTMKFIKEKTDLGLNLPGNIIFSAVVSEEAAEMFGMEYLVKTTLPSKGLKFDVCYQAEPTTGNINLGHRGKVEIAIRTRGKSVHSSRPWEGINALEKMLPILEYIFNDMGPNLPVHPILGRCSVTVTNLRCKPGALSIIPDECEISVDRRYLPSENLDSIQNEFRSLLENIKVKDPTFQGDLWVRSIYEKSYTGYQKNMQKHHPVWLMDKNHPFVVKTQEALRKIRLATEIGYFTGGVDGGMTAGLMGIPTIGFSGADEGLAHTDREHTTIDTILSDTSGYLSILCELFGLDVNLFN